MRETKMVTLGSLDSLGRQNEVILVSDICPSSTVVGIFRGSFEGRIEETSGSVFLENEIAVGMRESIYCLQ